jgi:hypothetical protein
VCNHLCPITASLDGAEELLAEYADIHADPQSAQGMITINRRVADVVREGYPCSGPVADQNGSIRCPLQVIIGDVFAAICFKVAPNEIPPEKVVAAERGRSTGQYL